MVHLCIAREILAANPGIKNKADFLLGSLAPDAVHSRPGFGGDDKKKSHLYTGSANWGEIENNAEWKDSIFDFYNKIKKSEISLEFIQGYLTHVLGDLENNIKIWTPFRMKYMSDVHDLNKMWDSDTHKEGYEIDSRLYMAIRDDDQLWENLYKAKGIDLGGIVSAAEMDRMIASIPQQYSNRYPDGSFVFRFGSPEQTDKFIHEEADYIGSLLFGQGV